jgi:hypothetical protein
MANKNRLGDLRDHLFDQLERLKTAADPDLEIRRSQAMAKVATQVINSVKVQLQFVNTIGSPVLTEQTSDFFRDELPPQKGLNTGKQLGPQTNGHANAKT